MSGGYLIITFNEKNIKVNLLINILVTFTVTFILNLFFYLIAFNCLYKQISHFHHYKIFQRHNFPNWAYTQRRKEDYNEMTIIMCRKKKNPVFLQFQLRFLYRSSIQCSSTQILRRLIGTTIKISLERVSSRDTGRSGSSNPRDSRYQGCTLGVTKAVTL